MDVKTIVCKIIITVVFLLEITTVQATSVSKDDLKKVEQEVLQQSIEHKKLQAQATQINMELTSVSKELINAAKKIQNNEEKLSSMEKQQKVLEKELLEAEENFGKEDKNLIRTLTALQNLAIKPTEALLVQPLSPVDIIRSAMILREVIPHLEKNAETIRQKLLQITQKKERVDEQIAEIQKQKKVLQVEHEKMKQLVSKKSELRNSVEIKSEQAKKNMDKLVSQAQDLRDLLSRIERQRIEKQKEEQRRAEERRKHEEKQSAGLIKSETNAITNIASGFVKAKGSLPLPARGVIISQYGDQRVKGVSSKGLTIATREKAQVISPFDGIVVFAGPFRGYGDMIIIEHGDDYLSLMAGLGSIDVELGQMLLAGEPVGQMPSQGEVELYIEIRKNNQPINPAAWFKI